MLLIVVCGLVVQSYSECHAEVTDAQRELVASVMERLLAVTPQPPGYDSWPVQWKIIDSDDVNAFATLDDSADPQKVPIIRVYRGFLDQVAEMNEHRLAFVLGHELAHVVKGHILPTDTRGRTAVTHLVFEREDEIEADQVGIELAVKAGFSYKEGMTVTQRFREVSQYTSFEGNSVDHPSWTDRIALLQTDEVQERLWRAMSAFETGALMLQTEQYKHAESCFKRVVREFPKCKEAWVNLGYAQLMRYCDGLEQDELDAFGVGQLLVGGFYERPESLAVDRGINDELWWDAVGSLQRALTVDDQLILAKAHLAIAYLVHPSGQPDVGKAAELFDEVAKLLESPDAMKNLSPLARVSLLANSWIGVHHSNPQRSEVLLSEIQKQLRPDEQTQAAAAQIRFAMSFTQAVDLAANESNDERRRAVGLFENYLAGMSRSSAWWPLAYEKYAKLATELSMTARTPEDFAKGSKRRWRNITSVTLADGSLIGLAEATDEMLSSLGEAESVQPLVNGTLLKRYDYPKRGVSVVAGREVIAIALNQPSSPQIMLQQEGLATQAVPIYVGMPRAELEKLLGDAWSSETTAVLDPRARHQFYPAVGVAVAFREGKVSELIVIVPPRVSDIKN